MWSSYAFFGNDSGRWLQSSKLSEMTTHTVAKPYVGSCLTQQASPGSCTSSKAPASSVGYKQPLPGTIARLFGPSSAVLNICKAGIPMAVVAIASNRGVRKLDETCRLTYPRAIRL